MSTTQAEAPSEERVAGIMQTVRFLYPDEQYPHDEETIRAMMVLGGTDKQITESIAIAAINMNVDRQSKTRYAAGVLRNLMNPRSVWDHQDCEPEPDEDDYRYEDDATGEPVKGKRNRWLPGWVS